MLDNEGGSWANPEMSGKSLCNSYSTWQIFFSNFIKFNANERVFQQIILRESIVDNKLCFLASSFRWTNE